MLQSSQTIGEIQTMAVRLRVKEVAKANGKPVESWRDRNRAWAMIVEEIGRVCKDLRKN